MNERIKELLLKVGWHRYEALDERHQKFAQLLLEDVMSICEDLGGKGMDGHYCVDAIAKKYSMHQWS